MKKGILLLKNELRIFFKNKIVLASIFLIILVTITGINSIENSNAMSLHGLMKSTVTVAFGSAKYGSMIGAFVLSFLTIFTLNKDKRKKSEEIINSCTNSTTLISVRLISILILAVIVSFVSMLLVFFTQKLVIGIEPDFSVYLYTFSLMMLWTLVISILLSAGLYLLIDSFDISFLVSIIIFFTGISSSNYLLKWVTPSVMVFSDFGGFSPCGKFIVYSKLLWTIISISIFLIGILFQRRCSEGLLKSFKLNTKTSLSKLTVFALIICLTSSIVLYIKEPYISKSKLLADNNLVNSKEFTLYEINPEISLDTDKARLTATVNYRFSNTGKESSINFVKNDGLEISKIIVNNYATPFEEDNLKKDVIQVPVPKDKDISIQISYEGEIKDLSAGFLSGYIGKESIYLLENSNWLLTPVTSINEFINSCGKITAPADLCVIPPGKLENVTNLVNAKTWEYKIKTNSLDFGIFAGKYTKTVLKAGDVDIEFYYSPKHEKYIKNTNMQNYICDIVSFYEESFGPYYTNEYPLKIVETSIYKTGGHSSTNVVTVSEYMFNRNKVCTTDNFENPYTLDTFMHDIEIIAHEISHQWWGTGVNAANEPPWSNEGLANYSAYKYISKEFPEDIVYGFTLSPWEWYVNKIEKGYYYNHKDELNNLKPDLKYRFEMEMLKAALYYKMPLCLIKGEKKLGEENFLNVLSKIYKDYANKSITFNEFLNTANLEKEDIGLE